MSSTALYGGALSIEIPPYLVDGSQFRPVPDHQEVFVEHSGSLNRSIIIEIVDIQSQIPSPDIGRFFFSDYCSDSDALSFIMTQQEIAPITLDSQPCSRVTVFGHMTAPSGDRLSLALTVFRLAHLASDVLVIFNGPGVELDDLVPQHHCLVDSFKILDSSLFA